MREPAGGPDPLQAALAYAEAGWPVFPCHTIGPDGCSCRDAACSRPGKHPRTRHGLQDATTDALKLMPWWLQAPDANVAIRTGPDASGLLVLDVDPRSGGLASLGPIIARLPLAAVVSTGGGGFHIYLRHPDAAIKSRHGGLGPGLDVKAAGGYVVAPPSMHQSGQRYRWLSARPEPPETPDWLVELLVAGPEPSPVERVQEGRPIAPPAARPEGGTRAARRARGAQRVRAGRYVAATWDGILADLQRVTVERNKALFYAARRLGELLHDYPDVFTPSADAAEAGLLEVLVEAAVQLPGDHPVSRREATLTARSGLDTGKAQGGRQ